MSRLAGGVITAGSLVASPADSGLLLVGHGTRDRQGTEEFLTLGRRLARLLDPLPVEACLLELQPPTISQGWQRLVDAGVRHIHVAPLLLFAAGHAKADIPAAVGECRSRSPGVSSDQSRPLSRCPELIDLVVRRLDEVLDSSAGASRVVGEPSGAAIAAGQTAVVMVGRGSRDPCAQADLRVLAGCVHRRRPVRRFVVAYYAMAEPKLPAVIDRLAADQEIRRVIVLPHILFAGSIHRSIVELVEAANERHPTIAFDCASYLGPEPELARAVVRRVFSPVNLTGPS